ncbi:MAG: peptidylprolyl isomerase [Campylobacterales bacterium]
MAEVYAIEYTVKNSRGETIDTNVGQKPLEFVTETQTIIPGLEKVVTQMAVGEEREVVIPPEEAYGIRNEEWVESLPREQFEGIQLERGMVLYGQSPDGQVIAVTVKDFNDKEVVVDYNHPLAGEELTFKVKLVGKRQATREEEMTGQVGGHTCECGTCNC